MSTGVKTVNIWLWIMWIKLWIFVRYSFFFSNFFKMNLSKTLTNLVVKKSVFRESGETRTVNAPQIFPPRTSVKIWSPTTARAFKGMFNFLEARIKAIGKGLKALAMNSRSRSCANLRVLLAGLLEINTSFNSPAFIL